MRGLFVNINNNIANTGEMATRPRLGLRRCLIMLFDCGIPRAFTELEAKFTFIALILWLTP